MHTSNTLNCFYGNLLYCCCILSALPLSAQWNPDAGLITPHTQSSIVFTSSGDEEKHLIIDGNEQTFWQSEAPLPTGYVNRLDLNILLAASAYTCTSSSNTDCTLITDTDLNSKDTYNVDGTKAFVAINFNEPTGLFTLSVKASVNAPMNVYGVLSDDSEIWLATYNTSDNFSLKRFTTTATNLSSLRLESDAEFSVFELAALAKAPSEYAIIDLGSPKEVGWITTRHWIVGDDVSTTRLWLSNDLTTWTQVGTLDPSALFKITTLVQPPITARYVKVEHLLTGENWKKGAIWEVEIYDKNGPYGPMPPAEPNPKNFNNLLGINGIWGWGQNIYATQMPEGEGADLYNDISTHARNYHNMIWDVSDPDIVPDYETMGNGGGTEGQWWLNWNLEYEGWVAADLKVQASIQFTKYQQPVSAWSNPYLSAYNYGYAFANYFGPTNGNGFIETMEVGNEPWKYPADFYQSVLEGMAQGAKDADPALQVFPCALQAYADYVEEPEEGNYMGARISEAAAQNLDGINSHHYSYKYRDDGLRIAVHPEHPESTFRGVLSDLRFRDANMPGKKLYMSEWGWDSDGLGEDCTHGECVTEQEQALYAIRGAMILARLGVDRASWYFYANVEGDLPSSLYARCGLTGSELTGFAKKRSFKAFETLVNNLGETRFLSVLQEDEAAYIYVLGTENGPSHLIAWRPINGNDDETTNVSLATNYLPGDAYIIDGLSPEGTPTATPNYSDGIMDLTLSAAPTVIEIAPSNSTSQLLIKAYLQGNYNESAQAMNTFLYSEDLLPSDQPFNRSPWFYEGTESYANLATTALPTNIADWILVEARNANNSFEVLATKAVLLLNDGQVYDVAEALNGIHFNNLPSGQAYYISIKSRNHLPIMSQSPVLYPSISPFDFTEANNIKGGNTQVTNLGLSANYAHALLAGDFDSNGVITVEDFNLYVNYLSTLNEYLDSDANFDGNVTVVDFNAYKKNVSRIAVDEVRYGE